MTCRAPDSWCLTSVRSVRFATAKKEAGNCTRNQCADDRLLNETSLTSSRFIFTLNLGVKWSVRVRPLHAATAPAGIEMIFQTGPSESAYHPQLASYSSAATSLHQSHLVAAAGSTASYPNMMLTDLHPSHHHHHHHHHHQAAAAGFTAAAHIASAHNGTSSHGVEKMVRPAILDLFLLDMKMKRKR